MNYEQLTEKFSVKANEAAKRIDYFLTEGLKNVHGDADLFKELASWTLKEEVPINSWLSNTMLCYEGSQDSIDYMVRVIETLYGLIADDGEFRFVEVRHRGVIVKVLVTANYPKYGVGGRASFECDVVTSCQKVLKGVSATLKDISDLDTWLRTNEIDISLHKSVDQFIAGAKQAYDYQVELEIEGRATVIRAINPDTVWLLHIYKEAVLCGRDPEYDWTEVFGTEELARAWARKNNYTIVDTVSSGNEAVLCKSTIRMLLTGYK